MLAHFMRILIWIRCNEAELRDKYGFLSVLNINEHRLVIVEIVNAAIPNSMKHTMEMFGLKSNISNCTVCLGGPGPLTWTAFIHLKIEIFSQWSIYVPPKFKMCNESRAFQWMWTTNSNELLRIVEFSIEINRLAKKEE